MALFFVSSGDQLLILSCSFCFSLPQFLCGCRSLLFCFLLFCYNVAYSDFDFDSLEENHFDWTTCSNMLESWLCSVLKTLAIRSALQADVQFLRKVSKTSGSTAPIEQYLHQTCEFLLCCLSWFHKNRVPLFSFLVSPQVGGDWLTITHVV